MQRAQRHHAKKSDDEPGHELQETELCFRVFVACQNGERENNRPQHQHPHQLDQCSKLHTDGRNRSRGRKNLRDGINRQSGENAILRV
ncbi:hypothetical protein D9M69_729880 [compost metagenome]